MTAEIPTRVLSEPSRFGCPDDVQVAIQNTLAALADVDSYFESELTALSGWSGPETIKTRIARELAENHQRDRAPYVQHLALLQRRMMSFIGLRILH